MYVTTDTKIMKTVRMQLVGAVKEILSNVWALQSVKRTFISVE